MIIVQNPKIIIYSCVTGYYDQLTDHEFTDNRINYLFFSDTIRSVPKEWHMRSIAGMDSLSNKDKNRFIKMHPHLVLPEHDISIYIDGNIQIVGDVYNLIDKCMASNLDIFMYQHPFRNCIYQEAETCIIESLEWIWKVSSHMRRYSKLNYPSDNGLFELNILIRKNTTKVRSLMDHWWNEYSSGAKRDQLSLTYSATALEIPIGNMGDGGIRKRGEYFFLNTSVTRPVSFFTLLRKVLNNLLLNFISIEKLFQIKIR